MITDHPVAEPEGSTDPRDRPVLRRVLVLAGLIAAAGVLMLISG